MGLYEEIMKKHKENNDQKYQSLIKERNKQINLPTNTENKPSPFKVENRTSNNPNNMEQVNQRLKNLKNYSKNKEIQDLVQESKEESLDKKIINGIKGVYNDSYLKDGYQFGDLLRTSLSTKKNIATNALHGLGKSLENFYDFSLNASTNINTALNEKLGIQTKEQAEQERKNAANIIKRDLTTDVENAIGFDEEAKKRWENGSLVRRNNLGGKVAQGVGEMAPQLLIGNALSGTEAQWKALNFGKKLVASAPTNLGIGITSYGGGLEEAYSEGATTSQANRFALGSMLVEMGTEWLTEGVPGLPQTGFFDRWTDAAVDKVSNSMSRFLLKQGFTFLGEGGEEGLSEIIKPYLQNATYTSGRKINWNDVFESFVVGGLVGDILELPGNLSNYHADVNTLKEEFNRELANENIQNNINIPETQNTSQNGLNIPINENINTNQNIDIDTNTNIDTNIATDEDINPLENIEEFKTKQKEIKNQQVQEETNERLSKIEKQLEQQNNSLSAKEYQEYQQLKMLDEAGILDNIETNRLNELNTKYQNAKIKLPELKIDNKFSDIKKDYAKYINDRSPIDYKNMDNALKIVQPNNQGRRTKQQWLDVANLIGKNYEGNTEGLKQYAFRTFFELQPNQKGNLNRQGQKYVNFDIADWVNEVYKGAGAGQIYTVPTIPTAVNYNQSMNIPTVRDFNNTNIPSYNKGNIPINNKLLNKYANAKEMMTSEINNYDGKVEIKDASQIEELKNIDISTLNQTSIYHLATDIFDKYNNTNQFNNNGNKIIVSHADIKESIKNIYNENQIKYLKEHLQAFSDLGDIIESATLSSQSLENKKNMQSTHQHNNIWSYYLNGLKINGESYLFEFDVVSRDDGENHYRVQRIQKTDASAGNTVNNSTTPTLETSVSMDNDTTTSQKSQISLPTKHNMQQKEKNIPTKSKSNNKVSMPMVKNNDVIKVASKNIAKQINDTGGFDLKQRSWVETATESDVLKDKVYIDDLDQGMIKYVVQSNKKSLDTANNHLDTYGYDKSLDYVKNIMQSDKLPSASDVALMQRMIQEASKKRDYETVQELIMDTAIVGTDLGQATQALSIIQKLTPEGQLKMYTKLVQRAKARGEKSFQNVEITPEMVQNILEAYDKNGTYDQDDLNARVEKFKQDIADQMKTTTGEKIDAWRYLSMLGNPKTHIRNMVSNIAMTGTIKVKNAMARTLESMLPVKERTKTWKKASNEIKNYAKQTAEDMKGIITGENKYNEKSAIESKKQIFKNKTLEKISNFNGNALEAEDWFFSKRAFQSTLEEYLTANGINTREDIQNNPELVEKAKLYAVEQAEIATFRQYSRLASMINQFERKGKVGKVAVEALMPFKKTPINVAKAGVNYSPVGLLKAVSYDAYQLKQGNINASQFIDRLSQGLTGTSLTLLGYALAKAGILSGSGGDDKEDKYDQQLGNTGYSLNIGGHSYSISWLSPVAMPLLVGSNAYEQLEEDKEWDMNVVSDTLAKTLDPLNEMSFMQGLTNALQSYGSGTDKIKGALESTGQNYVGQFFPTLFSQIASTTDDKKRSTKASNNSKYKFGEQTVRSVMYKIPGLRQQLEVATDIWGNEKEQSSNILERAFESFLAPYSKTKNISTDLDKEIKRVYNETGEKGVIPGIPYAYTKYNGETYRMSANEYTKFKKTYGQTANDTLNRLINSNDYKQATDEDKAKMIDNVYDYARAKATQEYFDSNDIDYSNQLLDKLDTLNDRYGISVNTYFANKNEYDYAYQSPDKYSVIKQIASYDKYNTYKNKITEIRNNTTNDKEETIKYINSLNMSIPQKAMFIKQYYKSFKSYDKQIIQYINQQKLSVKEKEQILTQLGFTVKNGRVY